jgi:hypothetical protein
MTDKEILDEVYRRLQDHSSSFGREGQLGVNRYDIKNFIEQEWQKADYLARLQDGGVGEQGEIGVTDNPKESL